MTLTLPSSVHGRFQPFHNGHLSYVLSALELTHHLYIGITQVERTEMKEFDAARHRSRLDANPLTYFERAQLVQIAVKEAGISADRFSVIPFPIERVDVLADYFPVPGRCFTTMHSDWNAVKVELLKQAKYDVVILDEPDRFAGQRRSGTEIRKLIRAGDDAWKAYVPESVAKLLSEKFIHKIVSL